MAEREPIGFDLATEDEMESSFFLGQHERDDGTSGKVLKQTASGIVNAGGAALMDDLTNAIDRIVSVEQRFDDMFIHTNEDGFFIVDRNGYIGMKYDNDGIDFAEISQHARELLQEG